MRPLHILYFIQRFTLPEATTESHPYQLALRWLEKSHKVTVVTSGPKATQRHRDKESSDTRCLGASVAGLTEMPLPADLSDRLRIICVRTFNGRGQVLNEPWFVVMGLLRSFFVGRVDIIYSSSTPWTAALPGYLLSWFRRRPLYYEVSDGQTEVHELVERWLYRRADKVIALTAEAEQHLQKFGKPSDEIVTAANGWEDWGLQPRRGKQPRVLLRRNHKVFDYMLAGCPIVAAARGEVVELIERAECGWWVQPERAKELADLIDTIRQIDPNELRTKGARGREFLLRSCLRRDLADKLEETFRQAC